MRRKYRHRVTGYVREYDESYAKWVKALEPVDADTPESEEDCGCLPDEEPIYNFEYTDPVFYAGEIKE